MQRAKTPNKSGNRRTPANGSEGSSRQSDCAVLFDTFTEKDVQKIVKELRAIDLVSNLDVDALARLVIAQENYVAVTEEMKSQPLTIRMEFKENDADGNPIIVERQVVNSTVERLALLQDRYFKQCRQGAADFGLTVSSRCRLVVPKADKETPKENKFAKFA